MQAVIYTRVSDDHSGRSRSTRDQEVECRAQCERQGWTVREVLCDQDIGASRYSSGHREAYQRLKEVLRPDDILVTWEASRAQRGLKDFVELRDFCEKNNILWSYSGKVFDQRSSDDRFLTGLDVLMAEKEVEQTRERALRGKRSAALEGRPGGKPPWGYVTVRNEKTGKPEKFIPDPEEAPLVRRAARDVLSGRSLSSITKELNADGGKPGIRPRSQITLRRCLLNPQIAGHRVYQGEILKRDVWEPVLDDELHQKVASVLTGPNRNTNKTGKTAPNNLLSFIARCGICGKGMRVSRIRSHQKSPVRRYYVCSSERRCVGRKADAVDYYVTEVLLTRLEQMDPSVYEGDDPQALADLAEIEALENRRESFVTQAIDGSITPATLAKIESGLNDQITKLKARMRPLGPSSVPVELKGAKAREVWDSFNLNQQRAVIRSSLIITINKSTGRKFNPEDIDITPI